MKSHHIRHSRYLLIALGMIGLIFWQRETMGDWMDQMRGSTAITHIQDTGDDTVTITDTNPALPLPTETVDMIISGAMTTDTTIVIGKDANDQSDREGADTEPLITITATTITTGSNSTIDTGDASGSGSIVSTATTTSEPITIRQPGRTSRQGKQFAYELANALDIGTGSILTTIGGYYDTQTLYDAWEQTQDTQMYHALIDRLESEYKYDDMVALLSSHTNLWTNDTPDRYIRALRESSQVDVTRPDTVQTIQDILYTMEQTQALDFAYMARYNLLVQIWNDGAYVIADSVAMIPDEALRSDMQTVLDYYATQQHVPEYYRDTLVAMVLVQHGYFHLAEKIALQTLAQDSSYILPRQILAYSSFTKHDRTQATTYLQELVERDPDNSEFYTFLRGIVTYRQEDYVTASLILRQTQSPRYLPDTVRYLALSYDHLNDEIQRDQAFAALLQYALDPSDYYTYFYLTFFQPFQEGRFDGQSVAIDLDTAKEYIRRCTASLVDDASIICEYGAVGVLLAEGNIDAAHQTLLTLYQSYPYSYIAHALGDYYTSQNEIQKAMRYYFLALRSTDSLIEQDLTKQKIWDLAVSEEDEQAEN